jgi:short-subunit dehydrogenase
VATADGDLGERRALWALESRAQAAGIEAAIVAHGIEGAGPSADLSAERVRAALTVSSASVLWVFRAVAATLRRAHGRFITVTSQAALHAEPRNAVYCAATCATQAWLGAQARIEGPGGIAIRALCPVAALGPLEGHVDAAGAVPRQWAVDEYIHDVLRIAPLDPPEIAAAAINLAGSRRPSVLAVGDGEGAR